MSQSTSSHVPPEHRPQTTPDRTKQWAIQTASQILDTLRHDHRFCANCFRQVREVEAPWRSKGKQPKDWMIGYATPTRHTIRGVDEKPNEDIVIETDDGQRALVSSYREKAICECGATHHKTEHRPLKKPAAVRYARNLSESINSLREEYRLSGSDRDYAKVEAWRHSTKELITALKHVKSQPRFQSWDAPFFEVALAVALRRPDRE